MKITNIEPFPFFNGRTNNLFVIVDTDAGIYGVGESGLTARVNAVLGAIEDLKYLLIGQDANRIEHIWQQLYRVNFYPAALEAASAISAIDIALWDIQGKALGVPVYQLLGGRVRDKVVCYPHCGGASDFDVDALVADCKKAVADGWKFVRFGLPSEGELLEPTRSMLAGIEMCRKVREAVGEQIEICIDVHTRLDLPDAAYFCNAVQQYRPYFIEDPLRSENINSYEALRHRTSVPLATGETFQSKWQFRELIEKDLIDYFRADLCLVGGLTEARKIAGWAETHYIKLVPHNPLGPVSTAACTHLNLAVSNFGVHEQHRLPGTTMTDLFPVQMEWKDGYILPPDRPGLGIELNRDLAKRQTLGQRKYHMLHREDGSLTNL